MDYNVISGLLLVGVILIFAYIRNSGPVSKLKIDPKDAKKRIDTEKEIILLDVRTKEEYVATHIPKSTLIPLSDLARDASKKLPNKQATIFAYCRSGSRSRAAVKVLLKQGYTNVFDLGGIISWPYKTVSGNK